MTPRLNPKRTIGLATALAAASLLGACASPVMNGFLHRTGVPNTFAYAAGGRDFTTVIIGNPFSTAKAETDAAVVDAMQGKNNGPTTHFTTTPSADARPGYRTVVIFNPPINMQSAEPCGDPARLASAPTDGRLRVSFAFCAKEDILSEVHGSVPATASPRDPTFQSLIGSMTRAMVPLVDPNTKSDDKQLLIMGFNP